MLEAIKYGKPKEMNVQQSTNGLTGHVRMFEKRTWGKLRTHKIWITWSKWWLIACSTLSWDFVRRLVRSAWTKTNRGRAYECATDFIDTYNCCSCSLKRSSSHVPSNVVSYDVFYALHTECITQYSVAFEHTARPGELSLILCSIPVSACTHWFKQSKAFIALLPMHIFEEYNICVYTFRCHDVRRCNGGIYSRPYKSVPLRFGAVRAGVCRLIAEACAASTFCSWWSVMMSSVHMLNLVLSECVCTLFMQYVDFVDTCAARTELGLCCHTLSAPTQTHCSAVHFNASHHRQKIDMTPCERMHDSFHNSVSW